MKASRSSSNISGAFVSDEDKSIAALWGQQTSMPECSHLNWTLSDAIEHSHRHVSRLPLTAFNHVSREVLDLEKSKNFYVDILGFQVIPRPPLDSEGYWLYGNNLNLHLIQTKVPRERRQVKIARIQHFSTCLPTVDHIAFLTTNIQAILEILDSEDVYYKFEESKETGISQIFMFDPDGNVIEISNCAPPIGEITCLRKKKLQTEQEQQDKNDHEGTIGTEEDTYHSDRYFSGEEYYSSEDL